MFWLSSVGQSRILYSILVAEDLAVTQLVKTVAPYSDNPSTRKRLFVCLGCAVSYHVTCKNVVTDQIQFVVIIGLSIKLVVSYERKSFGLQRPSTPL